MNQIINRNGQVQSCVGPTATSAFVIRTLIGAIQLYERGIKINARIGKKQLLLRAEQWTGKKRATLTAAKADLHEAMNAKVAECEVVNE